MTKSTITREQLLEIIETDHVQCGEASYLARMALAAMDSEPVALQPELANYPPAPVVSADLLHTAASAIEDLLTTKDRTGAGVWFDLPFQLRSAANAQPAPVVPEEATPDSIEILASARRRDHAVFQWDEDQRNAAADSWNAFRAAMLQESKKSAGAEATCKSNENVQVLHANPPVIPDGSASMLRRWLAFGRGMQNAGSQLPHNLIAETESMLAAASHDTPALNSVQSVLTVPGKWIPVSERMPDDDDFVYIWPRPDFGVELHVGQYCECSPKGDGWYAQVYEQNYGIEWHPITVTHWMPLPAGPKEVQGE
ncbi:DUF551 domain-containing protein [Klebsiella pneumoniae]|uniref:DUF551 domain-containing protein n=2 Tax=Klebsiella pneumoniae TaxID=573 RepID=UPI003210A33B